MPDRDVEQGAGDAPGTRRERLRASTIEEIKATARRLMAESGSVEARFSDIARAMGMTAPALYRYFRDRDELLTALISDGYAELADALSEARATADPDDVWAQFVAIASAYRAFALVDPARYALVFGLPVPGYAAPEDGGTTAGAHRAMATLVDLLGVAAERGRLRPPLPHAQGSPLADHLTEALPDVPGQQHQLAMHAWMGLHGSVSLEVFGHVAVLGAAARDQLHADHVRLVGSALGLTVD